MTSPLEPGRRVDRFEVVGLLGRGGMAAVWEVVHLDLRTRHALKVLQVVAPGLPERLVAEGRIQARLAHPNVCRVTDVVRMGDTLGLVMELVHGPSLDGLLASYQPNLLQADHLARDILAGVGAAHAAGLVHRDLKPANVLVEVGERGVVPKVSDFGLAKALDEAVNPSTRGDTRTGVTMGTPCYMAPEQFRDAKRADRRSDVFSIGCILYELVSGMKPFDGATPLDIYQRTSTGAYRPLPEVVPNVPERMARAVAGALGPDPAERFAGCAELLAVWCGEVEDDELEGCWEPSHLELLASLVDHGPVDRSTVSISATAPPERSPTAVPELADGTDPGEPPPKRPAASVDRAPGTRTLLTVAGTTAVTAVVSGTLGLIGLGAFVVWGGLSPPVHAPDEPAEAVLAAPEPRREEVASAPPEPPIPSPAPDPAAERPPPRPAPREVAVVTMAGGLEARLSPAGGGRTAPAGEVPSGRYALNVFFHPTRPTRVLDLTVGAGDRVVVSCNPQLKVCRCDPAAACR